MEVLCASTTDRWPFMLSQVISRAHRMGALRDVHVEVFILKDTVEETILQLRRVWTTSTEDNSNDGSADKVSSACGRGGRPVGSGKDFGLDEFSPGWFCVAAFLRGAVFLVPASNQRRFLAFRPARLYLDLYPSLSPHEGRFAALNQTAHFEESLWLWLR